MTGTLYVVGTPIGNLSDFSPRAVETLKQVDFIAAEDTRVTLKLLNHFEIKKPMVSYYEHNLRERGEQILQRILSGESCAVVSDAGMPCISDPGEDLVRLCAVHQVPIQVIPGPSAVIAALCVSGLVTSRFAFEGFLSTNKKSRMEHLAAIRRDTHTLIFYEAPHKLLATLRDLHQELGDRKIAVVKELTKIHETVYRGTLGQAVEYYAAYPPKGEFVLVVEGWEPEEEDMTLEEAVSFARELVSRGSRPSDAAKEAARISAFKKSDIYRELVE